jgi:predicted nucleic acid-binding Zn ribbon protein
MAAVNVGDAIKQVLESNGWKQRIQEIKLRRDWEAIVGKTVARYTTECMLRNGLLTIGTSVAPLKQELRFAKAQLIQNINDFYKERVVVDIIIK